MPKLEKDTPEEFKSMDVEHPILSHDPEQKPNHCQIEVLPNDAYIVDVYLWTVLSLIDGMMPSKKSLIPMDA